MRLKDIKRAATECQKDAACMRSEPDVCPMYEEYQNQALSPPGIFMMADAILDGTLEATLGNSITPFACTMCGACSIKCLEEQMHFMYEYPTALIEGIREIFIDAGSVPDELGSVLRNAYTNKNCWGLPSDQRTEWEKDCEVPIKDFATNPSEYLLYLGDTPLIQETSHIPGILATLLSKAGVDFATFKENEIDSGNEVRELGESGLFEEMASENIEMFQRYGVKKIITISPHDYHTFCTDYPKLGMEFDGVYHYTIILEELIRNQQLKPSLEFAKTVTFQDPCHLGRYNDIYEQPRSIIKSIPGVNYEEMKKTERKAFCCGGGGGRIWFDEPAKHQQKRINDIRVGHARDIEAEVIVTACPYCQSMLAAAGNLDDVKVMDIAELLLESVE